MSFINKLKRFVASESGTVATEYAVMLALIVLVAMGSISQLGIRVRNIFANTADLLSAITVR